MDRSDSHFVKLAGQKLSICSVIFMVTNILIATNSNWAKAQTIVAAPKTPVNQCARIYRPANNNVTTLRPTKTEKTFNQFSPQEIENYNWIKENYDYFLAQLEIITSTYGQIYKEPSRNNKSQARIIDSNRLQALQKVTFQSMTQSQVYFYRQMFTEIDSRLQALLNFPNRQIQSWAQNLNKNLYLAKTAMTDLKFWDLARNKGFDTKDGTAKAQMDLPEYLNPHIKTLEFTLDSLVLNKNKFDKVLVNLQEKQPDLKTWTPLQIEKLKSASQSLVVDLVNFLTIYDQAATQTVAHIDFKNTDVSRLQWIGRSLRFNFGNFLEIQQVLKSLHESFPHYGFDNYVSYIESKSNDVNALILRINNEGKTPNLKPVTL